MTVLSTVSSALERSWTAIRTVYPDVRTAAIVVYLHPRGDRRGHFAEAAWTTRAEGKLDEVHVSSHILSEGPESVMRTLLHEACHSMAVTRGVKDVSRQGRYHNKQFFALAQEIGLVCEKDPAIGTVTIDLTPRTRKQFENPLQELGAVLELWQNLRPTGGRTRRKGSSSSIKLKCPSCLRIIRASVKTVSMGPIACLPCQEEFVPSG
jgi:hypothetical protein